MKSDDDFLGFNEVPTYKEVCGPIIAVLFVCVVIALATAYSLFFNAPDPAALAAMVRR